MAEETKKTAEEKLLSDVKADAGSLENKKTESGDTDEDNLSPEQKLINELTGKLTESERRAEQAEASRDSERSQRDSARKDASTAAEKQVLAQEELVKSKVSTAKSKLETAEKEFDDAYDSGDKEKVREATKKMNRAQIELGAAEYNETAFKNWKEGQKNVVSSSGSRFTPKEQSWIDKNPRFNTDRKFKAAVYAADEEARQKGIEIDSDAYFEHIEGYLDEVGLKSENSSGTENETKRNEEPKKEETKKEEKKNNSSSTAAPVGGGSGSGGGGSKKQTFTLTPEHRKAAQIAFPDEYKKDPKATEEKYAKYQMQIQQNKEEGKR